MSTDAPKMYKVTLYDWNRYEIVIEAEDERDAEQQARHRFLKGHEDEFEHCDFGVDKENVEAERIDRSDILRAGNDAFRAAGPTQDWVATAGVVNRGGVFLALALRAVGSYADFTSDNDPHGEHDFGRFSIDGETLLWKIDYYEPTLTWGSADPTVEEETRRVLTVMLASEY